MGEHPEQKPEPKAVLPKFMCVCAKCFQHNSETAMLEFNFRDMAVYYVCPCGHRNMMALKNMGAIPLPRSRLS